MQIKQSDLFFGVSQNFVKEVMTIAEKRAFKANDVVFRSGDAAESIYILITGEVRLAAGELGRAVYSSSKTGDLFGWSSLIGRPSYSASALCQSNTVLLKIDRTPLLAIIDRDPVNGLSFFKHLAAALGNRLMNMYRIVDNTS